MMKKVKNQQQKRNPPMKLIREEIESVQVLTEESNGKKHFYIQGPFLQGDIKNRNGRIYESYSCQRSSRDTTDSFIDKKSYGWVGSPRWTDSQPGQGFSQNHITETRRKSNFIGKAKILETPMGRIAGALLNDGVTLGVSSRGMGSLVSAMALTMWVKTFMLATAADIVADPSAPDAFVQGIMEGKEWVWDNGLLKEQDVERVYNQIRQHSCFTTRWSNPRRFLWPLTGLVFRKKPSRNLQFINNSD